jgi:hypothetical protein
MLLPADPFAASFALLMRFDSPAVTMLLIIEKSRQTFAGPFSSGISDHEPLERFMNWRSFSSPTPVVVALTTAPALRAHSRLFPTPANSCSPAFHLPHSELRRGELVEKRFSLALLLAIAFVAFPLTTHAKIAVPQTPHPAIRVGTAECIIVGKVTSIEDKSVDALPFPGATEKAPYTVAVVKVDDAILGAKGLTHVRVGFRPPQGERFRPFTFQLEKDQEVCLVLQSHHDQSFYTSSFFFDAIDKKKNAEQYDKDVAALKKFSKLLADPKPGLTSKNAQERLETAAMLVAKYRTQRPGTMPKTEALDAEESKQILKILADADWRMHALGHTNDIQPLQVFQSLGLTDKDGWTPPKDFAEFRPAAQKWLKDNAEKYRIQRFVLEKKDK